MRENLGWVTNCSNAQSCPQNWLDLSASELSVGIQCAACGQRVELVQTVGEFEKATETGQVSAYPVVPCVGMAGVSWGSISKQSGMMGPAQSSLVSAPPIVGVPAGDWFAVLSNGERIKLDRDVLTVGRSRKCDVVVPSAKISREHATLRRTDGKWFIEDLGSANGLWRNEEKITRVEIRHGDVFQLSDETLGFELG